MIVSYSASTEKVRLDTTVTFALSIFHQITKANKTIGSFFKPHYDGMFKNEHGECSIFTITLYLNSDFEGGRLRFLDDKVRDRPIRTVVGCD